MSDCIIHIGSHKTGSTSIQHSLEGFQDDAYYYARLDMPNHSLAVFSLFSPEPARHHIHRARGLNDAAVSEYVLRTRANLEKSIAAAGRRTLLISGEDISVMSEESLVRMRDYLKARFDRITVVGYVRPPAGFIASGFQQRVKSGSVAVIDLNREYRSYARRFLKFDQLFGRENVRLWKFDPALFPERCVVRDFCNRLGIGLPASRIVRMNESLPREVVALLFTYRRYAPKLGFSIMRAPEGQRVGNLLSSLGKTRFRFAPDMVQHVLSRNREDIRWMEARLGQPLDEELGKKQPEDVGSEADLLRPDPVVVGRLIELLGSAAPEGVRGETPEEVAKLVYAFRMKHAQSRVRIGTLARIRSRIRTVIRNAFRVG